MTRVVLLAIFYIYSSFCEAENITVKDLAGVWVPSGEMPREKGINNYELTVNKDLSATYSAVDSAQEQLVLSCEYKPSDSQSSIFVYYCYLKNQHLITLSLGGWKSESGQLLYGYEYWLGYPKPGQIHGGLPVSLEKNRKGIRDTQLHRHP